MNWVEQLKPDDDVAVEIIWPEEYTKQSLPTMSKYASAIAHLCKAAAILEDGETEFSVFGINVLQTILIETIFEDYGVQLAHEHRVLPSGERYIHFYADVRGLQERLGGKLNVERINRFVEVCCMNCNEKDYALVRRRFDERNKGIC